MKLPTDLTTVESEAFSGVDLRVVIPDGLTPQTDLSLLKDYGTVYVIADPASVPSALGNLFTIVAPEIYEALFSSR